MSIFIYNLSFCFNLLLPAVLNFWFAHHRGSLFCGARDQPPSYEPTNQGEWFHDGESPRLSALHSILPAGVWVCLGAWTNTNYGIVTSCSYWLRCRAGRLRDHLWSNHYQAAFLEDLNFITADQDSGLYQSVFSGLVLHWHITPHTMLSPGAESLEKGSWKEDEIGGIASQCTEEG